MLVLLIIANFFLRIKQVMGCLASWRIEKFPRRHVLSSNPANLRDSGAI